MVPALLEWRRRALAHAIAAVEEGGRIGQGVAPSPVTAEGIVGGIASVLYTRILARSPQPLVELTGAVMSMIVLPYFGAAAARHELGRARPKASGSRDAAPGGASLGALEIRITYRTLRVLEAIAVDPGASNSAVGRAAGISDNAQTSKLLARLRRAGVIENGNREQAPRGGANAWSLTGKGRRIVESLGVRVEAGR